MFLIERKHINHIGIHIQKCINILTSIFYLYKEIAEVEHILINVKEYLFLSTLLFIILKNSIHLCNHERLRGAMSWDRYECDLIYLYQNQKYTYRIRMKRILRTLEN